MTREWTTEEIVEEYQKASFEIAQMISKLNEMKGHFESISEFKMDNADPECDAAEALEKLGMLLSSTVIYANEYAEDLPKEKKEEK